MKLSIIFDAQIAEILGVDVFAGQKKTVWGITGVGADYYTHRLTVKVGGWPYDIEIGFFDLFVVKFDLQKEEIELTEKKGKK